MRKYDILRDAFEARGDFTRYGLTADDVADLNGYRREYWPEVQESFDTLEEARAAFEKKYRGLASTRQKWGSAGGYADIVFYELLETVYDEDGDQEGFDIIDEAFEPLPVKVEYEGGESRDQVGADGYMLAVDYMLAEPGGIELYAERPAVEGSETGTFAALKADILEQAAANGIPADMLDFME